MMTELDAGALLIIKVGIISVLLLYCIFSLIVVKQVSIMTDTLRVGFEKPIKAFSIIHFFAAALTFFISITIL